MNIFFHSNACVVCRAYGRDVNFQRCSNCKMVGYCSLEHQREHWPLHKDICKVLANRIEQYGSLFPPSGEEEIIDSNLWFLRKQKLMSIMPLKLGRRLLYDEIRMLLHPRSCEVCHETNPQKLVDCPNCPSASFCKKHTDAEHQEKCKLTVLVYKLERKPPAGALFNFAILNIGANIPEDMEGIAKYYREHYNEKENAMPVDMWSVMNVEHLWRPYTFLYGIEKLSMSKFPSNIHVLGADGTEIAAAAGWEVLLHHANVSKDVAITFIGPELKDCAYSAQFGNNQRCKNKKILVNTVAKLYHDYMNCDTYTKPNAIVGFNLGIHMSLTYDWAPTIKKIERLKCPFLVTAFTKDEMTADRLKINSVLDKIVEPVYFGKNPYHALIPLRNPITEEFCYSGHYLMIYEKL